MPQHIFVLGLEPRNLAELEALPNAEQYIFHSLLTIEEMLEGRVSFPKILQKAQDRLDQFEGLIDAIVGYWDFPVNMLVPILSQQYGLRSKELEAVVKCEHKYWSRLEQQNVIDEHPAFGLIDVDDPRATLPSHMTYPVWVKPIQSFSSQGAHYAADEPALRAALETERQQMHSTGDAFDEVLKLLDLPDEVADISGHAYMVEEAGFGQQCTLEGYSWGEKVEIIGVVDSILYDDAPSFLRYQYPSQLPEHALAKMAETTRRVIGAIGLRNSTFNIEYFWDEATQHLALLEINSRHSQSHAQIFRWVDGMPNHLAMMDLALGRRPHMPEAQGEYRIAAKWMLRRFSDGFVHRVPSAAEIAELEQRFPAVHIKIVAKEHMWLSDLEGQDSYSFMLAEVYVAGQSERELRSIYDYCCNELVFTIEDDLKEQHGDVSERNATD